MATDGLFVVSPGVLRGRVSGDVPNKSNSRKIATWGKRPSIIKSQEALDWVERVVAAVFSSRQRIGIHPLDPTPGKKAEQLFLYANVWPSSMMRDLDVELLPDALQKAGVIVNDRHIWTKTYFRAGIDPAFPRVEFEIGVRPKDEWVSW